MITFIIWPFFTDTSTHKPPSANISQSHWPLSNWVVMTVVSKHDRWPGQRNQTKLIDQTFHVEPRATYTCCVTASAWMQSSLCRQVPFIFGSLGNMRQSPVWALQMTRMPHMPLPGVLFIFQTFMYYSTLCVCVCVVKWRFIWTFQEVLGSKGVAERSQRSDCTALSHLNSCPRLCLLHDDQLPSFFFFVLKRKRNKRGLCLVLRSWVCGQAWGDEP